MAGERVLIIEDRRENIVYLANNVLKAHGYQVLTAMDGEQGLKRALAEKPDLIIMDLNMPKRDGLEVMAALRERQVEIPVILTTFYGSEQVAQQAYRLGVSSYIVKPYGVDEMLAAVQKALAKRARPPQPVQAAEAMPLSRQLERWMRDMNILHNVGKALVAQLDLNSVLARAVEAAIYIIRADQAFLFLTEPGQEASPTLRAVRGPSDRQVRLVDQFVDSELAAYTASSDKPLLRGNARGEPELAEIAGNDLGPLIAAPLRWRPGDDRRAARRPQLGRGRLQRHGRRVADQPGRLCGDRRAECTGVPAARPTAASTTEHGVEAGAGAGDRGAAGRGRED